LIEPLLQTTLLGDKKDHARNTYKRDCETYPDGTIHCLFPLGFAFAIFASNRALFSSAPSRRATDMKSSFFGLAFFLSFGIGSRLRMDGYCAVALIAQIEGGRRSL